MIIALTALLAATGGVDSIFQDLFALVLVVSAIRGTWSRLAVDTALVVAANLWLGLVAGSGPGFWRDLVLDLAVWLAVAVVAGVVVRRLARTSVASRRLESAVDLLEDAVLVVDAETFEVQYANRSARAFAGGGRIVGRLPWEVGPWPDAPRLEEARTRAAAGGASEVRHDHPDGERVLEVLVEPVRHEGGEAIVLLTRDITERYAAERRLEQRERRFRALAEDSAGIVYRLRLADGVTVEYVSPQVREVLGFEPQDLHDDPGLILRQARPADRGAIDLAGRSHVYAEQGTYTYQVRHADGRWVWIEDHHTPEFDDHGRLAAVQGIAFDVSTRWQAEAALAEALRRQETATETMRRTAQIERTFIQSVSHELRTPMTAVLGFARTLHSHVGVLPPDQQSVLLERLLANTTRLEQLLDSLMEFDRYTRGQTEAERRPERVDRVVGAAAEQVPLHGRRLRTRLEPVVTLVDRPRLERCVEHLLANAVRHTPVEATIELTVVARDEAVHLIVADDGPGVAPDVAENLFAPFSQGPEVASQASPGIGFGLAMVRVCARLHGGDVWHEQVVPHGARFVVSLPLVEGQLLPSAAEQSSPIGE